jgi:hypothetical protein
MLTGMPTEAQFSKFGGQIAWKADFDNINQPKYTSQECNPDVVIRIITLLVSLLNLRINLETHNIHYTSDLRYESLKSIVSHDS